MHRQRRGCQNSRVHRQRHACHPAGLVTGQVNRGPANIPRGAQRLPNVAERWIGEMEEIAQTFDSIAVTSDFHTGAAWTFREVAAADIRPQLPLDDAIEQIATPKISR